MQSAQLADKWLEFLDIAEQSVYPEVADIAESICTCRDFMYVAPGELGVVLPGVLYDAAKELPYEVHSEMNRLATMVGITIKFIPIAPMVY